MDKDQASKQAQIIQEMAENISKAKDGLLSISSESVNVLNGVITPEIEEMLSDDQKSLLRETRSAFDFSSGNPLDKLESITKTLRNANFSK